MAQTLNYDYQTPAYANRLADYIRVEDCLAGSTQVKAKGAVYLPHPALGGEASDPRGLRYAVYKKRALFMNMAQRTLTTLVGIAFGKAPVVTLGGALAALEKNANGEGVGLTQLMRDALAEVLATGRAGILADTTGTGANAASVTAMLKLYKAKEIINWRITDGILTLVVIRYFEDSPTTKDEFEHLRRECWLELRLVDGKAFSRRHYRTPADAANGAQVSSTDLTPLADASGAPLTSLPFSFIGAINNDPRPDNSPMMSIVDVNISHYQALADAIEAARITGQPTLVMNGLTQTWVDRNLANGVQLGATEGVVLPVGADAKIIQANETSASTKLVEMFEAQAAKLGAALIERNGAIKTATEAASNSQSDNSVLSLATGNVEAAFNAALMVLAGYADGSGEVLLNKRYAVAAFDSQLLTVLMAMVNGGTMTLSAFVQYQITAGLLPENTNVAQLVDELQNQGIPGAETMAALIDRSVQARTALPAPVAA